MKQLIREGMRKGDLADLVLPLLSVDEYTSKVDEESIVFAFYVSDYNAASDLNRYIQKSPVPLIDTEVSPAPDQRGHYLVFFEIMNNDKLGENAKQVLDEVAPLADIEKWDMQVRGLDDLVPFSSETISKYFVKNDKTDGGEKERADEVLTYVKPSGLTHAEVTKGRLFLEGSGYHSSFEIVAFGPQSDVYERHKLHESALDLGLDDLARERRLQKMLGEGWSVVRVVGLNVVQHEDSTDVLVLKD